jgi:hypothetical protein
MNENKSYVRTHIDSLKGKKLETLDRGKPFTVDFIHNDVIIITTSSNKTRNVPLQGTIDAYNHLIIHGKLTRTEIEEQEYTIRNTAYMAAVLASFPEIEHTIRPITLNHTTID